VKNHISIAACASLFACAALNLTATETVKLDAVEVQGGSYGVSQSGIDEGILNKEAVSGPLAGKKIQNMPYQINTLTRELMDNQIAQQPADLIKFFPPRSFSIASAPRSLAPKRAAFKPKSWVICSGTAFM
jgi:tonB dependent receptor